MDVHVVSKSNNSQHATFSLPGSSSQEETPLKPSSVRVRATLLGLASNNLTYALGGTRLHWWDAYPVPPTAPAPYNDSSEWGIVPAWGLASVIESSIPDLPAGTSLYGLWPTSAHVVDLELTPAVAADAAEAPGHWREVSSHRASLMPLYNQYRVFETHGKDLSEFGWDVTVGATMKAGYVLSEYVFTPDPVNHPPVHPLAESEQWTVEDADLSKTVFVSLAAATKTARSMAYNFFCRPRNTGPLAFLQVTSRPRDILEAAEKFIPQFPVGAIAYEDVVSSGAWIARLRPERVVVADFGARDGALNGIVKAIESTPELQSTKVTVLAVGNQQKVYTPEELQASRESFVSFNKIQMNASAIQETAARHRGLGLYHEELQKRWDHWLKNRECAAPDLSLVWGKGIVGARGLEGGWEALCQSKVRPGEALVYRV